MDSAITQTIAFFGAIAVALVVAFGAIITAFEAARYRRAATLAPLQQAATDTQLNFLADKMAPVIGGWAATTEKLDSTKAQLSAASTAIDMLQKSSAAEREANRKLDQQRDQQLGELRALEALHAGQIGELRGEIAAKNVEIGELKAIVFDLRNEVVKANEQLRGANEQLTRVLHGQQAARPGGHTQTSLADHAENVREDAAAFAGASTPVPTPLVEAAIAPPGGIS